MSDQTERAQENLEKSENKEKTATPKERRHDEMNDNDQ